MPLSSADARMVRLFMAGCFHSWDKLPALARDFREAGASVAELRGCVRHLITVAGYGPCLAATLALHKAGLLPEDAPAKVGGPPGDAFELVYTSVTDAVRRKMHAADPVLGEWIRLHLYGDIYSSPGLDLRQKQLLMCAFLAEADMHDQLFGHALAALRFGNQADGLEEAARISFAMAPRPSATVQDGALKTLAMALAKYRKDYAGEAPSCPAVHIPDPRSVFVPPLPAPYEPPAAASRREPFVWEEVDSRYGKDTGAWRGG